MLPSGVLPLLAATVNPLAALLLLAAESNYIELRSGRRYRIVGELKTGGVMDITHTRQLLELVGASDVQISQRAPHRLKCTISMGQEVRMQRGVWFPLNPMNPKGLQIRIDSATPVQGTGATATA